MEFRLVQVVVFINWQVDWFRWFIRSIGEQIFGWRRTKDVEMTGHIGIVCDRSGKEWKERKID